MASTPAHSPQGIEVGFHDLALALRRCGGEQASLVAKNPKMLKSTFDMLIAIHKSDPLAGMAAVAGGASNATKMLGVGQGARTHAQATSAVLSTFKASMALANVAKLNGPAAMGSFVGAIVMQKTGVAMTLAGGNSARATCIGAIMEMAGSATVAVITAPTGVLAWLSLASLAASTYHAHLACSGQMGY